MSKSSVLLLFYTAKIAHWLCKQLLSVSGDIDFFDQYSNHTSLTQAVETLDKCVNHFSLELADL